MYSESEKDYKLQMHETPQNNSKYTLILFTCELWVLQVVVRMLVIHSYMAISIIFFLAMFLQLIWFDPRLQQDVGDYNYFLGWYLFFNLDRMRSELPKSHRGCWSLWWGHFKFFFSIISFLKTNVRWNWSLIQHFLAFYET